MKEQLKAEAYVRSQRPALYRPENSICSAHMVALNKDCDNCQTGWLSPNLHHWLAVLGHWYWVDGIGDVWKTQGAGSNTLRLKWKFNMETGQPDNEAAYKAFNDIVGI